MDKYVLALFAGGLLIILSSLLIYRKDGAGKAGTSLLVGSGCVMTSLWIWLG